MPSWYEHCTCGPDSNKDYLHLFTDTVNLDHKDFEEVVKLLHKENAAQVLSLGGLTFNCIPASTKTHGGDIMNPHTGYIIDLLGQGFPAVVSSCGVCFSSPGGLWLC